MRQTRSILTVVVLLALTLTACERDWREDLPDPVDRDLSEIRERDTLHVLTTFNSTSYFIYRGQPMGYEYELLREFAKDQDLEIKMHVQESRDSIYQRLNTGVGDVVAARVVPMAADSAYIAFTRKLYQTQPVVVQREDTTEYVALPESVDTVVQKATKPSDAAAIADLAEPDTTDSVEVRARLIEAPAALAGKRVPLPYRSEYTDMLVELTDTLTGDVHIVEIDTASSYEKVIRYVAAGDFDLTVSPRNIAKLKESYFTNIFVRPAVGPTHDVSWAVRQNASELRQALNDWIAEHQGGPVFEELYTKYFVDRRGYREREESKYLSSETGRLSEYDELLQTYADTLGWDWRLLASQTYQESLFNPRARSWAGAAGLLQLMPATAAEFGVTNVYDPEQNVAGAVRFLEWLHDYWDEKIEDKTERRKFILASYNTGHGHVEDARRLTEKHGGDTEKWADVAYWLLQKSKREIYQDPVVKYGFCRGLEPVTYVSRILDRYDHYSNFVIKDDDAVAESDASEAESDEAMGTALDQPST